MLPTSLAEANKISTDRLSRGREGWLALEASGGLWPPCGMPTPPAGILEGMGEYDAMAVQAVLRDALPKLPAERAWPWVASAIFIYERERSIGEWGMLAETNADTLVQMASKQAMALRKTLHGLNFLSIRTPEEVGAPHYEKALQVVQSLQKHFAGTAPKGNEYRTFANDLKAVADICKRFNDKTAGTRKRGAADPYLSGLVYDLAGFWKHVSGGKAPSAADPVRKDGKPAPFVRLVNGCLDLAGGPRATPKQVATAINNPPTFTR